MPSEVAHIAQARGNARFRSTFDLATTQYPDWAITTAFYTALHLLEALFARQGLHCHKHEVRNKEASIRLQAIAPDYMLLYNESLRARYSCAHVTSQQAQLAIGTIYSPLRDKLCQRLGIAL